MDIIRDVNIGDAAAIAAIYNHYVINTTTTFETEPVSCQEMARRIEEVSERFPYYVLERGGKVCGFCYAHPWKERAAYAATLEITIYIADEAVGNGYGKMMVGKLIDECRKRGFGALIACVTSENSASCRFHQKMGFKQVSLFERVGMKFGRKLDVADFILHLDV